MPGTHRWSVWTEERNARARQKPDRANFESDWGEGCFVACFRDDCEDADKKEIGAFTSCAQDKDACESRNVFRAYPQQFTSVVSP